MTHAEKCPVCNGNGMIYFPPLSGSKSAFGTSVPCHGCGGKGWIEVRGVKPIKNREE